MTKSERGRLNRAVGELRAIGADPDEVVRRAAAYRIRWPGIDLTPTALAANWSKVLDELPPGDALTDELARRRRDAELAALEAAPIEIGPGA